MTAIARGRAIALIGAAVAAGCASHPKTVRVGSKNFTESFIIAEIYAQTLEAAGLNVVRRFNLGSTQIAMEAIRRGDIDLYPEYTGTALINVLNLPPMRDADAAYATVKRDFAQQFDLVWLKRSPMNDSQAMVTTREISQSQHLQTLSQLSVAAPRLRLATIQEFLSRLDGLPGLQEAYGGFHFKEVRTYDIALKYQALLAGRADVASAFSTDGALLDERLVLLRDDKHFWPPYEVAPVVRKSALQNLPQIKTALNAIAPAITDTQARRMNAEVESQHKDPADVAAAFLATVEPSSEPSH